MKGIGVSEGIGIGKVFVVQNNDIIIEKKIIEDVNKEVYKLEDALDKCKKQIDNIYESTLKNVGEEEAAIFIAHKMILDDLPVINEVKNLIKSMKYNSEYALKCILDKYIKAFENIKDDYFKERALDIKDIGKRLSRIMLGIEEKNLKDIVSDTVLIAKDLTPSDTSQMDKEKIKGIVLEDGGTTSHTAIIARTMEISNVIGVDNICSLVKDGDEIICDGFSGKVIINPTTEELNYYSSKIIENKNFKDKLKNYIGLESHTKDNIELKVKANIGTIQDIDYAIKNDAEGIGLFRSEFLYMKKDKLPSEQEQFEAYKKILISMNGKPVVIRTLDIGGDKNLPYLDIPKEMNPFLGYRAIRLCLDNTDIFKTQLRAILRASIYGNVKILFPMISSLAEIKDAKKLLNETKQELLKEGIEFNDNIELGMMIEIPSAAIISDILAKEVDFFSIGTNDLIQYVLAVDRMNVKINHLYSQYHPALIRLLYNVIKNAHNAGIKVAMCGEMAGESILIPMLVGMGLDEFSMSPSMILRARSIIRNLTKKECETYVEDVLSLSTGKEVEKYLIKLYNKNYKL